MLILSLLNVSFMKFKLVQMSASITFQEIKSVSLENMFLVLLELPEKGAFNEEQDFMEAQKNTNTSR